MSDESLRVLMVEDSPADVQLVLHELQQAGFHLDVIQVDTEEQYLARLESAPDIILCDYNLPQFDAVRALELLHERRLGIPFLIVSGSIGEETAVEVIKRGANDYLLKDRLGRLGSAVKQALKQRELREAENRAQKLLKESEARLQLAQRIAGLGTWVSGLNASDSLWWSDQTYQIFGLSHDQFGGRVQNFFDAVYPGDRAAVEEASRAAFAGERPYEIEHRIVQPDGTIRWVHQLAEVIHDPNGQFFQMIGVVQDITVRREREAALRASQAMLALVLDTIPQGVFWKDRNSAYLGANRVSRQATGVETLESLIGRTDFEFSSITREQAEFFVHKDREVMSSNQPQFGIEETLTLPDGSTIWLETNKVPMRDPDGHVIGILGTWQDITERKRTDDELRASRERLQVLSRQLMSAQEDERRHIARELHDEIGQALTGIKLNLNTLLRSIQSEPDKAVWQDTLAITNRTLEQVRNLSLDLRPSMLDDLGLPAALRWYLDRQAQRAGFAAQFVAESAETGVSKDVETVCFRIAQECLTNISRHAQARHVRVELHRRELELELLVIDDGIGFDVRTARERATRGASLGLLGMQERVLLLGGQLEIESISSHGTQVRVRFPFAHAERIGRTERLSEK